MKKIYYTITLLYRFEAVDRDLHPPLCGSTIPPQPLRPAPQPRPTARPRPSPLQTPSTIDYIRMHEASPLTPPPSLQRGSIRSRAPGPSVFLFQSEPLKNHDPFQSIERPTFVFDNAKMIAESIQMTPYSNQNHVDSRLIRYNITLFSYFSEYTIINLAQSQSLKLQSRFYSILYVDFTGNLNLLPKSLHGLDTILTHP